MAKAGRGHTRRDSKRRVLRLGESVRADDSMWTGRPIFENKDRSKTKHETGICYSTEITCKGNIGKKTIRSVKTSDAKLFLIKL